MKAFDTLSTSIEGAQGLRWLFLQQDPWSEIVKKTYTDGDFELKLVDGIEEDTEILFFFEGDLGIFLEFVEVKTFGVDQVKDLAELDTVWQLLDPLDFSLSKKGGTLVRSETQVRSSALEGRLTNIKKLIYLNWLRKI